MLFRSIKATKNTHTLACVYCNATCTDLYLHRLVLLSLPMKAGQLVVGGSRRAPTPPPDGPTGSPESVRTRPRVSFLSLSFRGAAPLAALTTPFRSCFWCSNGAMCTNHYPIWSRVNPHATSTRRALGTSRIGCRTQVPPPQMSDLDDLRYVTAPGPAGGRFEYPKLLF